MIYYGDETGFYVEGKNGFGDPYNRATFPWDDETFDLRTRHIADPRMGDYYARLGAIRHALPALARARSRPSSATQTSTRSHAWLRQEKPVIVLLNKAAQPTTVDIPVRGLYPNGTLLRDQKSSYQTTVSGGRAHVELFPWDGVILVGTS